MSGEPQYYLVRAGENTASPVEFPADVQPGDTMWFGIDTTEHYARRSVLGLQQSRWCFEHDNLIFFCEHKHT